MVPMVLSAKITQKSKLIPTKHRKYKLITTTAMRNYTINQVIYDEANNTTKDL